MSNDNDNDTLTREQVGRIYMDAADGSGEEAAALQLLAAMDDRDFWQQRAESMQRGLNGLSAAIVDRLSPYIPEETRELEMDVLPSTIGGIAKDRARLQAENAEFRATLAAERGEPEGAPSEGWQRNAYGAWIKGRWSVARIQAGRYGVVPPHTLAATGGCYQSAREAMKAADAAREAANADD